MSSGRSSSERPVARRLVVPVAAACVIAIHLLMGAFPRAQETLPPPPDSLEPTPTPTPGREAPRPKAAICPRCGYRCENGWHYCVACGWDLTSLTGEEEEKRLQNIARSTVGIVVGGARRNRFATAFPYGESGLFLTNARNLIGADESSLKVRTFNNREYHVSVVGYDLPTGVGVVKAEIPNMPATELAPAMPAVGDSTWAVCYPVTFDEDVVHYLPVSLHRGHLTAAGQSGTFFVTFENLLRTDHAIEDGCSGGPLVDSRGRVAGMILGGPDEGITYATPLDGLHDVISALLKHESPVRPYFGIALVSPDPRRRAKFGIDPGATQPMIAYLIPDAPAVKAGLRPGDLLVSVAGGKVGSVLEAGKKLLAATPGGSGITVIVSRGGVESQMTVSPVTRPGRILLDPIDELQESLETNLKEIAIGPSSQQGLVIMDLVRGGRGEKDHFKNGDIISAVGRKSIHTFATFDEEIRTKFKDIFVGSAPSDKLYASSYFITLEVRREGQEKMTREYVNLFPDILAPPVY